jgi:hypothetical protein
MNHNLHLLICKSNKWEAGERPTAAIYVNPVHVNHQGFNLISPDCLRIDELEAEVARLKRELDHILEQARAELAPA